MQKLRDSINSFFQKEDGVVAVLLFGSQARGSQREDSDVDIAVLYHHNAIPNTMQLLDSRERIADQLNKAIDLVCLNTCSPIIGMQSFKYGEIVLVTDRKTYDYYLIKLFNQYTDLKYMRKPAENAILERKYYGGS